MPLNVCEFKLILKKNETAETLRLIAEEAAGKSHDAARTVFKIFEQEN